MEVKYYECHVTVNPVFGEQLERFTKLAQEFGFKPAKLLMQKRAEDTPERSAKDTFCTAHDKEFDKIEGRMRSVCTLLVDSGFTVYRNKIEAVILDERHAT